MSIMERLKQETMEAHKRAEAMPLERLLISGQITRENYAAYLGQRYFVHGAVEQHMAPLREADPRVAPVLGDRRFHCERIAADLRFLGVDPASVQPLPATVAMTEAIHAAATGLPVSLIGFLYVFEGSTNGARYIAMAMRRAHRFEGTDGTNYLDPYGDDQRALWEQFRAVVNGVAFTTGEQDSIVAAAQLAFEHMIAVDTALMEA